MGKLSKKQLCFFARSISNKLCGKKGGMSGGGRTKRRTKGKKKKGAKRPKGSRKRRGSRKRKGSRKKRGGFFDE